MNTALRLVPVLSLALFTACGTNTGNDGGNTGMDGSTGNTDAATTSDVVLPATASGVTATMCQHTVDLNAMGTLAGETVSITGNTNTPLDVMPAPCNPAVTGRQLFHYTVRGDNVWLKASTNNPGGTALLDTVVWALSGACTENSPVLACNDDDPLAENDQAGASTLSTPSLARGTEVTFVVGAYARVRRGAADRGNFTLTVTETPSAAAGADCDSSVPGGCVSGFECAANSPTRGVCVTPSMETEPNNTPDQAGTPLSLASPIAIHAAIMPAGDVDCYALAVAANSSLFIEASDGGGGCPADLRADLYRAGETAPFEGDDDSGRATDVACPRVEPVSNAGVANMPAGTYVLCIRGSEMEGATPTITAAHYSVQVTALAH